MLKVGMYANHILNPYSGIGRYAVNVARLLPEVAPDIASSLLFTRDTDGQVPDWATGRSIIAKWTEKRLFSLWDKVSWPSVEKLTGDLDVFHYPHFFCMPHKSAKWVMTVHDMLFKVMPDYHPERVTDYLERVVVNGIEKADCVICVSRHTADDVMKFALPRRIEIVHNGIERDIFYPRQTGVCLPVLEQYGIKDRFILYVGRIDKRRNLKGLVAVFRRLLEVLEGELSLVIAGAEDNLSDDLAKDICSVEGRERIRMLGAVPLEELPYLYSSATVFVYPSAYEGFGLPPLEAAACGAPVIAGDNSSQREMLAGVAELIDPFNLDQLDAALRRILDSENLRREMREAGIDLARRFDWRESVSRTAEIYRSLIA
ncbi:MAG TPA: glycosyltransferase family 1 protein [Candidatus Brocadiia bacterium]|nr:glycosyltransferase family 1 protein [Candidatus Brocadiia bacterium]